MPHFDIVKKSEVKNTYRVARVMADYDVKADHANEHFTGEITFPDDWHIGCIVGGSGTGKTTIARELFGDYICGGYQYTASSVLDDMPKYLTNSRPLWIGKSRRRRAWRSIRRYTAPERNSSP